MKKKYRDFLIFSGVMFFTIILELALDALKVKEENIYLVFVLSILIIIIESKSIVYGLMASVVTVLSFNFFITEPKFTFVVDDPNHYVSFVMFFVVTFMVSSLVTQLQRQVRLSKESEKKINILYDISTDLIHAKDNEEILEYTAKRLDTLLEGIVSIIDVNGRIYGDHVDREKYEEAVKHALQYNEIIDMNSPYYKDINSCVFPIKSRLNDYGAAILKAEKGESNSDVLFTQNVIEEILVALDKNYISNEREQTKIEVEKEKFKTSLLRGLSHDLKTPLTMIQSGSEFLYDSFDNVEDTAKKQIIKDIYDESCDLSGFVNNLLDLTRFENKDLRLNKTSEAADDIIFEVLEKMKRRLGDIHVEVRHPEEVVMVYSDVGLLSQVFVNLLDNVISHTHKNTNVIIDYYKEGDNVVFKIMDDGGGISKEKLDMIFEDFYSITANQDRFRNHGLGLSICKAIVEAHGGHITAENNEMGGTTFTFIINNREENDG